MIAMYRTSISLITLLCIAFAQPVAALQTHYDPHDRLPRAVITPDLEPETSQYFHRTTQHILSHMPPAVCRAGEWIQFFIAIDMRGRVGRLEPHAWKASKQCFATVIKTILDHAPLPTPPQSLRTLLWRGGLIFTFTQRAAPPPHQAAPVPTATSAEQLQRYRAQVTTRFLSTWQKVHCTPGEHVAYRVSITASGIITQIRKDESNASQTCEDAALATINRASPLPPPPAAITHLVLKESFRITFRR